MPRSRTFAALASAAVLAAGVGVTYAPTSASPAASAQSQGLPDGQTKPSKERELAFSDLGKVLNVAVEPGSVVQQGDLLMEQDDRLEQAQLTGAKARADISERLELARKQLEAAEVERDLIREARRGGGSNDSAVRRAELEVEVAQIQIREETRQGLVAAADVQQLEVAIERKRLYSPIDGVVTAVEAAEGEVFGPQTPALTIVSIDPLEIELNSYTYNPDRALRVGETVRVRYEDEQTWRDATVKVLGVAGPGAGFNSQTITLSLPNPDGRPAGLNVFVDFGDAAGGNRGGEESAARR